MYGVCIQFMLWYSSDGCILYWVVCRYLTLNYPGKRLQVCSKDRYTCYNYTTCVTIILHVLQLYYMCYNYTTCATIILHVLHVLQLYYMYYNTTCVTIILHVLQLYYMCYNYTTCVTIILHVLQLYYMFYKITVLCHLDS